MIAVFVALILSVFLFKKWETKFVLANHFYWFLISKLSAGIAVGLLYNYHYGDGDTFYFYKDALTVSRSSVSTMFQFLINGEWKGDEQLIFIHHYKALFYVRLISLPLWLCQCNYWALSVLLSLFSFWSIWLLSNKLVVFFKVNAKAVLVAFFYFPEVLFWSSGVMKETLSFSFQCLSLFSLLLLIEKKQRVVNMVLFTLFSYLLFRLKFYIAATFVPALIAYYMVFRLPKWKEIAFVGIYFFTLILATFSHPLLSIRGITNEIYENALTIIKISEEGKFIPFHLFDGSFWSMLLEIPNALLSALFRPFLWEGKNGLMAVISLIRFDFLIATLLAMYLCKRVTLEGVAVVCYGVLSVTLLTLSTPNYGTLSRYMVASMPFLLVLVLTIIIPFLIKAIQNIDVDR